MNQDNTQVQELMRKRVIVENKWPECPYEVGDILIGDGDYYWVIGNDSWSGKIPKSDVDAYPYLMRPLKWWEERNSEDMPEYVKFHTGRILKVKTCGLGNKGYPYIQYDKPGGRIGSKNLNYCTPSTEEEYNQYKKTNRDNYIKANNI